MPRGRPKKTAASSPQASRQPPGLQSSPPHVRERLVNFDDIARVPRRAAVAATAALSTSAPSPAKPDSKPAPTPSPPTASRGRGSAPPPPPSTPPSTTSGKKRGRPRLNSPPEGEEERSSSGRGGVSSKKLKAAAGGGVEAPASSSTESSPQRKQPPPAAELASGRRQTASRPGKSPAGRADGTSGAVDAAVEASSPKKGSRGRPSKIRGSVDVADSARANTAAQGSNDEDEEGAGESDGAKGKGLLGHGNGKGNGKGNKKGGRRASSGDGGRTEGEERGVAATGSSEAVRAGGPAGHDQGREEEKKQDNNGQGNQEEGTSKDSKPAVVAKKKSHKKQKRSALTPRREGSRLQPKRGAKVEASPVPPPSSVGGGNGGAATSRGGAGAKRTPLTVDTGAGVSFYPKRIRTPPDLFKAGPSTKPASPSKATTPARGSGKAGDPSTPSGKTASSKKDPKGKAKSPIVKKPSRPATPPPPPPPPPPYRFEYKSTPVVGGSELLSVGTFLHAAVPIMKFGRGFEVKMRALEDAVSCELPQENDLLSMVHSRLLCTSRELKALRPGENKYPYSWWTDRLKKRLADWYRRRGVLRELIYEAERSDDEESIAEEAQALQDPAAAEAEGGSARATGAISSRSKSKDAGKAAAGGKAGGGGSKAERRVAGWEPHGGALSGQGPTFVRMGVDQAVGVATQAVVLAANVMDGQPQGQGASVTQALPLAPTGGTGEAETPSGRGRASEGTGSGMEETKGGEAAESLQSVREPVEGKGDGEQLKRVSATQCKVCNTRGTVADMVKCIYETCGHKYHLRCLSPPLTKVPKGQWYCADCRAKKRVYGCNACMQNDRPSKILQCDGPKCGLEYHLGCLDPPLSRVPDVKWWYCPECVRVDNRVGCRVCKDDVDYDKLLKCDGPGCDLEWHTYCLKPPLKVVPKGDFFCPYCKAKQKVEFEKKREQDMARANERRRRREARRARAAEAGSDDEEGYLQLSRGSSLQDVLREEVEDLEPDALRLELHRVDILLRNVENARDFAAEAEAAAQQAADNADGAEEGAADGPAGEKAGGAAAGEAAATSSAGGLLYEEKEGLTDGDPHISVYGEEPGSDGDDALASASDGAAAAAATIALSGGAGEGGTDCDGSSSETDTVRVFWAAVAAAQKANVGEDVVLRTTAVGKTEQSDEEEEEEEKEEEDGPWGGAGDSPLAKDKLYESLSVPVRVGILGALCEAYMDEDHFRQRVIDETDPDDLRRRPFGYDSTGRLYFRFGQFKKEMRVYRSVEKDSPIPPVDSVATQLTGGGILEAAASRKSPRLRGGAEVELVADSLEGMEELVKALGKSKSKSKRDDVKLHANLAEEVQEMRTWVDERMEKEEKRRLAEEAREKRALAAAEQPRRRSGRLVRAESGWAVAPPKEDPPPPEPLISAPPSDPQDEFDLGGGGSGAGGMAGDVVMSDASDAPGTTAPALSNGLASPMEEEQYGGAGEGKTGNGCNGGISVEALLPQPPEGVVRGVEEMAAAAPAVDDKPEGEGEDRPATESALLNGEGERSESVLRHQEEGEGGEPVTDAPAPTDSYSRSSPSSSRAAASYAPDAEDAAESPLGKRPRSSDPLETQETTQDKSGAISAVNGVETRSLTDGDGSGGVKASGRGGAGGSAQNETVAPPSPLVALRKPGAPYVDGGAASLSPASKRRRGGEASIATPAARAAVQAVASEPTPISPPPDSFAVTPQAAESGSKEISRPSDVDEGGGSSSSALKSDVAPPADGVAKGNAPHAVVPVLAAAVTVGGAVESTVESSPGVTAAAVAAVATPTTAAKEKAPSEIRQSAPAVPVPVPTNGRNGQKSPPKTPNSVTDGCIGAAGEEQRSAGGGDGGGVGGSAVLAAEKSAASSDLKGGKRKRTSGCGGGGQGGEELGGSSKITEGRAGGAKGSGYNAGTHRSYLKKANDAAMGRILGSGFGGAARAGQQLPGNGYAPAGTSMPAKRDLPAAEGAPVIRTPPLHGMSSNGALDIMALAASSRPRAATPSTCGSPSRSRSGSGGSGSARSETSACGTSRIFDGSSSVFFPLSPPRGVSSALDIMAEAVQARAPAPLLNNGGGGGARGGSGGSSDGRGRGGVHVSENSPGDRTGKNYRL